MGYKHYTLNIVLTILSIECWLICILISHSLSHFILLSSFVLMPAHCTQNTDPFMESPRSNTPSVLINSRAIENAYAHCTIADGICRTLPKPFFGHLTSLNQAFFLYESDICYKIWLDDQVFYQPGSRFLNYSICDHTISWNKTEENLKFWKNHTKFVLRTYVFIFGSEWSQFQIFWFEEIWISE